MANDQKKEQKPKGWFSRRHETKEAHFEAQRHRDNRIVGRPKQVWNEEFKEWEKQEVNDIQV